MLSRRIFTLQAIRDPFISLGTCTVTITMANNLIEEEKVGFLRGKLSLLIYLNCTSLSTIQTDFRLKTISYNVNAPLQV